MTHNNLCHFGKTVLNRSGNKMEFSDKLVFLMKITQTSNKELAAGISVDPSLISLLRTGKRKQPQNANHIRNMAAFFSNRCSADFQRNALSEMTGQSAIRSSMPPEILANHIANWLTKDADLTDHLLSGMEAVPADPKQPHEFTEPDVPLPPAGNSSFYFGEEGRREVMKRMMKLISEAETPGSILISSDDNLEWLLSDYTLRQKIQANFMAIAQRGFTIHQIMPAINFLPRFAEALQFWLPIYSTGKAKVYYYPRLRDNLYRRSMIILPGRCVRISSAIGLGSSSDVTMFSTDPDVVNAHIRQFEEHLALCRPALAAHTEFRDFVRLFSEVILRQGNLIAMGFPLPPYTIPHGLFERLIRETDNPNWKATFQSNLEQIADFENLLAQRQCIDISRLATPEEVCSGKVCIGTPFKTYTDQPVYTPETYILHLKNILRLMDQYENYYFVPYDGTDWENYNLIVNGDGPALLIRRHTSPLMIEMQRPGLVLACQEHLLRKAEKIGYDGISKEKSRIQIQSLIKELQRKLGKTTPPPVSPAK